VNGDETWVKSESSKQNKTIQSKPERERERERERGGGSKKVNIKAQKIG
jgi:hypothetical protein